MSLLLVALVLVATGIITFEIAAKDKEGNEERVAIPKGDRIVN